MKRQRQGQMGRAALDSGSLCFLNRCMVPSRRAVAMAAVLLIVLALVPAGLALHEHEAAGHADCDACHFRHLSGIVTHGAPGPSAPDLVAHAIGSPAPHGERGTAIGICPTRGPPA